MKFRITGAVRETGHEISKAIEAESESEAREIAQSEGLLVESVEPVDDGLEQLAAQELTAPAVARRMRGTLPYQSKSGSFEEVVGQARWIRALASIIAAVGWLYLVVAALILIGTIIAVAEDGSVEAAVLGIAWMLGTVMAGVMFLGGSAVLRMFASMGLMMRDHVTRSR